MYRDNCMHTIPASSGISRLSAEQMTLSWRGWVEDGRRLLAHELAAAWSTLKTWHRRATARSHLAQLDARMLDDIGLTPDEARRIASKPFWKA